MRVQLYGMSLVGQSTFGSKMATLGRSASLQTQFPVFTKIESTQERWRGRGVGGTMQVLAYIIKIFVNIATVFLLLDYRPRPSGRYRGPIDVSLTAEGRLLHEVVSNMPTCSGGVRRPQHRSTSSCSSNSPSSNLVCNLPKV